MRFKYNLIRVKVRRMSPRHKEDEMLKKYGYIGERIRKERTKYDLSLSELAKEIGVSVSLLSLVENGKATPSMTVLDKICSFFSIHMSTLFEEENSGSKTMTLKSEKQIEVQVDEKTTRRFLLPRTGVPIEPVLVTIEPGMKDTAFSVHKGVEFGFVLEGSITVEVEGSAPVTCSKGDSVFYRASQPHRLTNPKSSKAVGLWIGVAEMGVPHSHSPAFDESKKTRR